MIHIGLQTGKHVKNEEYFRNSIEIGATAFEIFFDGFTPDDLSPQFKKELMDNAKNVFLTVHSPILSLVRSKNMEIFESCLDFAKEINAYIFTIHGDISSSKGVNKLEIIIKKAQDFGIKIGLENTFITTSTLNSLYNKFKDYENVGITFDIGHAGIYNVSDEIKESNPIEFLKHIKGSIIEVHAHNNDGLHDLHARINDGVINPEPIFNYLINNLKFDGPIIMEYIRDAVEEDINYIQSLIND